MSTIIKDINIYDLNAFKIIKQFEIEIKKVSKK